MAKNHQKFAKKNKNKLRVDVEANCSPEFFTARGEFLGHLFFQSEFVGPPFSTSFPGDGVPLAAMPFRRSLSIYWILGQANQGEVHSVDH